MFALDFKKSIKPSLLCRRPTVYTLSQSCNVSELAYHLNLTAKNNKCVRYELSFFIKFKLACARQSSGEIKSIDPFSDLFSLIFMLCCYVISYVAQPIYIYIYTVFNGCILKHTLNRFFFLF